jgi:formamidopyrimidine-DNA glycosylase
MPELPEVETMVRAFRERLVGRTIAAFEARWARQVSPDPTTLARGLAGRTITSLGRRAKHALLGLDDGACLLVHFGMSGRLEWSEGPAVEPDLPAEAQAQAEPPHARAVWHLEGGARLFFCDARKFGRLALTRDLEQALAHLGPEPLEPGFTPAVLQAALGAHARALKPLLLDQAVVAGLGNIYTDEALFRARLHPLTRSDRLTRADFTRLHAAIRHVLEQGILHQGTTFDWVYEGGRMQEHLAVYGREGLPCPACGTPVTRLVVGQRGTHVCSACQRRR